jgi:hypothetical protein
MKISDESLSYGQAVMEALLGVDALYRAESGDEAGLAVLNLDAAGTYRPEPIADYLAVRRRFEELRQSAARLSEPDRRAYYGRLCTSTIAFADWRDGGLPFQRQLADFLHVPAAPASESELDALRADMKVLLDGMGYVGDLRRQCSDWEARNRVPADEVPDVLRGLLDEAWKRTEEQLLAIPAPKSDGMSVRAVSGVAYNARCDYLARTIELNVDPTLTRPALKHLAVHEGYPGHYLQFKLRETMALADEAAADVLLSVVNTASSSVFEGIADAGLEMLGWVESDDDRLQALMNRYRAGIGTVAAWKLHAQALPTGSVTDWLRHAALVGGDGWVENRVRFVSAPQRAVLIWSYWWGERSVAPAWRAVTREQRTDFLHFLHGRMHSIESVAMFPFAVTEP